jgi:3-hydroxybutyrate dehydrogenase
MRAGWGRLIAIASIAGLKGIPMSPPMPRQARRRGACPLGGARGGAHAGITVNAICPGFIDTEMTERTIANIMAKTGRSREQAPRVTATNPQRRLIQPAEVTAAALYLCQPGSEGVNGQAIAITGGEA